jgi:C1A family cysteine protease
MDDAFYYVMDNGLCSEAAYPYKGVDGSCATTRCASAVGTSPLTCYDIPENNQVALKAAVAITPVSIAIEADKRIFQSYSSGVITGTQCGTNLDHGVLIVGYGEERGAKYWLVKNSWDTTWGDEGYIKIGRSDSADDAGVCGIAMSASFPSFSGV